MPYKPEEIMEFGQALYFQPGMHVRSSPYIATAFKMFVEDQEFGYYPHYQLDGTVDGHLHWLGRASLLHIRR